MSTRIMLCSCKDDFQDKTYGKGMRVHNLSHNGKNAYCTVCSPGNVLRKLSTPALAKKGKTIGK